MVECAKHEKTQAQSIASCPCYQSLRVAMSFIEHTPEHVRAEKFRSINRAYRLLQAPADSQNRARELIAALHWSTGFIMKHTEGRAGSELGDAFALLREFKLVKRPKRIRRTLTVPAASRH